MKAGDSLADVWKLENFENASYHLSVNGPNGFMRQFSGDGKDPLLDIACEYHLKNGRPDGNVEIQVVNLSSKDSYKISVKDHAYKANNHSKTVGPSGKGTLVLDLSKSFGWYDFSVLIGGADLFEKRYAGRVETGKLSFTDPAMGQVV